MSIANRLSIANRFDKNRNIRYGCFDERNSCPARSWAGQGPGLFEALRPQPAMRAGSSKRFSYFFARNSLKSPDSQK
jgi:hypothetical protein